MRGFSRQHHGMFINRKHRVRVLPFPTTQPLINFDLEVKEGSHSCSTVDIHTTDFSLGSEARWSGYGNDEVPSASRW